MINNVQNYVPINNVQNYVPIHEEDSYFYNNNTHEKITRFWLAESSAVQV